MHVNMRNIILVQDGGTFKREINRRGKKQWDS